MKSRTTLSNYSVYALLFLLPLIVYHALAGFEFLTAWDDGWMVFNRHTTDGLGLPNLADIASETNQGQYSPVNQLIYTILHSIFGLDPLAFHLMSVLYHAINTCLVYAFVKALLGLRERENVKMISTTAFISAILFAVHPMNIEAISWISASKIPLYTLFGLSALISYMRYLKTGKLGIYALSFVLFVFAFLCKEQGCIIPIAALFIDWYARRNFRDKKIWLEKIPFLAIIVCGGLYTLSLRNIGWIEHYVGFPMWQRLVFASYSITEYLTKLIVPTNLMYIYPFPMMPGAPLPHRFLIYPVIFAALAGAAIYFRKYKLMVFGALFFLLNLALTLHIISMSRISIVSDRYVYLSSIGFFMPAVWYGVNYVMRLSKGKRIFVCVLFGAYLFYLTGYTMKHVEVWENNDTLKKDVKELLEKRKIEEQKHVVPKDSISEMGMGTYRRFLETLRATSLRKGEDKDVGCTERKADGTSA